VVYCTQAAAFYYGGNRVAAGECAARLHPRLRPWPLLSSPGGPGRPLPLQAP
jgi:hypothetical protein